MTRRLFLATGLPVLAAAQTPSKRLNVVCVGGHPDDPESGCAGTLARYSAAGHAVTVVYLTRGEAGIRGKSHEEAAAIRTAECEAACKIMGAAAVFAGQIDGATVVDAKGRAAMNKLLSGLNPHVLLTHWPVDSHPDHQAASVLTYQAWLALGRKAELFHFEVNLGEQSMGFRPTDYVDISAFRDRKKAALLAHKSQDGEAIYRRHHQPMEEFRGREIGRAAAEAFSRLSQTGTAGLPGLG
jgi:LmbE family N-acetylglucosaminyl deacetylase